jgi:hypothetical protein
VSGCSREPFSPARRSSLARSRRAPCPWRCNSSGFSHGCPSAARPTFPRCAAPRRNAAVPAAMASLFFFSAQRRRSKKQQQRPSPLHGEQQLVHLFLPWCPEIPAARTPSPPQQQQLDPPILAGANLSHGALQQTPWSIPAMARDPASSLLVCCCAVPRWCLLCARRNAQQATRRRFPAAAPTSPRSAGSLFYKRSEQHAVDTRRLFAVFAQPHRRRHSPPVRPRQSLFDSASALFSYD